MKLFIPEESDDYPASVDLEHWISLFPLMQYRLSGCNTAAGPLCLAINEQIRRKAGGPPALGRSLPVDVFVLGRGEPKKRQMTKIGGFPYRPAGLDWPKARRSSLMTFLAQFDFSDSKDIVDKLPGDVLLIFTTEKRIYSRNPVIHFEWFPSGIEELVQPRHVPGPSFQFVTCFGVRFRTVDYLEDERAARAIEVVVAEQQLKASSYLSTRRAYRYHGLKIGGVPFWLYDDDPIITRLPGRFLCSLTEVSPYCDTPYPWLNVPAPLPSAIPRPDEWLYWYDGFTLNFFLHRRTAGDGKGDADRFENVLITVRVPFLFPDNCPRPVFVSPFLFPGCL